MPILAGFITSFFTSVFTYLAARLTLKIAIGAAIAATAIASILVLKTFMFAIWIGLNLVAPVVVTNALQLIMPANLGTDISLVILIDQAYAAYRYWLETQNLVKNYIT